MKSNNNLNKKLFFVFLITCTVTLSSLTAFTQSGNEFVYVPGIAPITMDGNLDDWKNITTEKYEISNWVKDVDMVPPDSKTDLSADFMCFADKNYIYIGIEVTDEKVIFGTTDFGSGWNDDAVVICFDGDRNDIQKPYFDENDGNIRIVPDPSGKTYLEGAVPCLFFTEIPYFWDAAGVIAKYALTGTGYNVEVAIPFSVLGWDSFYPGRKMGLNIHIDDDDDGDLIDSCLSWTVDFENTNVWKTEKYNEISFSKEVVVDGMTTTQADDSSVSVTVSDNETIDLVLNKPYLTENSILLMDIIKNMKEKDWETADNTLTSKVDSLSWVEPILSIIMYEEKKYDKAAELLNNFHSKCKDARIANWANIFPMHKVSLPYREFYLGLKNPYPELYGESASILYEYLKNNPTDETARKEFIRNLKRTGNTAVDYDIIQKIKKESTDQTFLSYSEFGMARYNFLNKNYDETKTICNKLKTENSIPEISLGLEMMLLSCEQ